MNYLSIILLPSSFLPFSEALTHYNKGKISCDNYCYLVTIAILLVPAILLFTFCYACLRQFFIKHKVIINQWSWIHGWNLCMARWTEHIWSKCPLLEIENLHHHLYWNQMEIYENNITCSLASDLLVKFQFQDGLLCGFLRNKRVGS
jgi:hypothetical protein